MTYFIFSLFVGCIVNNVVLELILKYALNIILWYYSSKFIDHFIIRIDSGSGPMLTFFQFAATSLLSAFQHFDIKNLTFKTKVIAIVNIAGESGSEMQHKT